MLPLMVYPKWLQQIAQMTPLPGILGERSALAIHYTHENAFFVLSMLLIWGSIGAFCLVILYRKGLRIVTVEGG